MGNFLLWSLYLIDFTKIPFTFFNSNLQILLENKNSVVDFNRIGLFRVENFGLQSSTRLINNFQPGWNLFLDFNLRLNPKKISIEVKNLQPGWRKIFKPIKIFFQISTQGWIPKNFQSRLKIWVAIFNPVGGKFSTRLKKKIWVEYRLTRVDLKYFCIPLNLRQLLLEYLSISFDPSDYYLFKINQK